jgi:maleylacetoacetate isomerase
MAATLELFSYWRSSAAYRVRIGLNLKGLEYTLTPVHLLRDGGEQHTSDYARLNPQQLVPALRHGGHVLTQSLAILEYLDETWRAPSLLPADPVGRARVRALAQLLACDVHPLNNLRVVQYFEREWQIDPPRREAWMTHWMRGGFDALEQLLQTGPEGRFCHGDLPGLADCCLLPQLYNARRFSVDLSGYPAILCIEAACQALEAFDRARPENQPDAI